MERLYHARMRGVDANGHTLPVQNPIELDNRAFNIPDGDKKMLDYLDYSSTMTKGALAAIGSIKLPHKSNYNYEHDYGAYSPYEKKQLSKKLENEEFINSWDNIFLNNDEINSDYNFFSNCTS